MAGRPKAATSTHTLSGSFTCRKYATWDKRLYFPSEGRGAEDFFCPEKSDGFEHANLGTKGQHGTSRPPKPLFGGLSGNGVGLSPSASLRSFQSSFHKCFILVCHRQLVRTVAPFGPQIYGFLISLYRSISKQHGQ